MFGYENKNASTVGFEPTTSGLEVRRAIHCATRTYYTLRNTIAKILIYLLNMVISLNV